MELRDAINAAMEEPKDAPKEELATEMPATEVPESESADKSADAQSEQAAPESEPAVDQTAEKAAPEAPAAAPTTHRVDRAPASWRKEAKGEWASVPLHIRQEVHKREMEISRALNEANLARQAASAYDQTVQPYMARIQALGVTPQQAFSELLKADYLLATGTPQQKATLIDKLLQDYGVDVAELDSAIARRLHGAPTQPQVPDIQALVQQQLQQALAPIYQQQRQAEQQAQQQADMTVEQMSLDPKYPHFDEVREEMADLVEMSAKRGVYLSLDQAYSRAIGFHPEIVSSINLTQQNQAAQRAKAAAASVSGAPASMNQQHVSSGNLRDDILAAFSGGRL